MINERSEFSPQQWSDSQLLSTAARYGEEARKWKNKFLGLLPEIDRRKLWKVKGFTSVVHFAKVIGGVSEEQVSRVIHLDRRFEEVPMLRELLTSGEVSVNKLARVASVVTVENEEFLVNQVQMLPQAAIETLVRDIVRTHKPEHKSEIVEDDRIAVSLDREVAKELLELREKGIDINELIEQALRRREEEIEEKKEAIGEKCEKTNSRYIPKATRDILKKEYGTKCSIQGCEKPWTETHHTQRFAMSKTHDPRYLAPVCEEHHDIAHSIDVKVQEKRKVKQS